MMKKLMKYLFLSCLKATELIEKKINTGLSLRERIQLRLHTTVCDACSSYEKQNYLIEKALEKQLSKAADIKNIDLKTFEETVLKKTNHK